MIKLYGTAQSRAMRVLWLLEELGVPYELVKVNFAAGETRKPEYLAINPNGHVPALVDGDVTVWESMAINFYLAEKYGKDRLWPATERERALTLQWTFWVMMECEAHVLACLLNRAAFPPDKRDEAKARAGEEAVQAPLGVLDAQLKGREYLLGNQFGLADLNVASVLSWAKPGKVDLAKYPSVSAWLGRCTGRPAFKAALGK
jgi:glutathione S-transferase